MAELFARRRQDELAWWLARSSDVLYLTSGVAYALEHRWVSAGCVAFFAVTWTRNRWRKHRRRSGTGIGYKVRAILAAMSRKMRGLSRLRPVLRPAAGGAA